MINIENNFNFNKNDKIVVGCSTGSDSMALLNLLLQIREKYNLFLVVAHVNHNVRRESKVEEMFMQHFCAEHGVICETMTIEEYGDDNFHNEARKIRYNFFETIVHKYDAQYLMTAHHGDDLVETILMRIVRGSNLNGYSGFRFIVDMGDYKIVRPLVGYTKKELEDYDKENNVVFFEDSSNKKDKYTRNRYRKYVLPFLKSEDNDVHLKFLKYSNLLADASVYIKKSMLKAKKRCMKDNKIMIDLFLNEDEFIQREILYDILKEFYQDDLILINDKHIELILNLLRSRKANSFINLPNNVLVKKIYNTMVIVRDVDAISGYEIEFDRYAMLPNNHSIEMIDKIQDNSNNICRLNSMEVAMPLIVRTRKMGDRIKIKGLNGSKKVKDIFIDKKISLSERDSWPIVLDSRGEVVWIPGIKKSKFDKKNNEEYDIILKYN